MENIIEVTYDGEYPNTCSGTLTIKVDGEQVYTDSYACHSTGSAGVNFGTGEEFCTPGKLLWEDDKKKKFREWFDEHYDEKGWTPSLLISIEETVKSRLSECSVCCGGCI